MLVVVASRVAVSTRLPTPNRIPFGLISTMWPLAESSPRITDGSTPVTRLSMIAALDGCWKTVRSPTPIEKLCQLMIALFEVCLIVTWLGELWTIVALPPTTVPFCGLAEARPTIRADADTPASRPFTSGRRRDRSSGRTSVPRSSDGTGSGGRRWDLRSRAARRAEVIGAGSELALRDLVDIR